MPNGSDAECMGKLRKAIGEYDRKYRQLYIDANTSCCFKPRDALSEIARLMASSGKSKLCL